MDTHMTTSADDRFTRDIAGLAAATATPTVDLPDGGTYDLLAAPVRKRIGDTEVRLLAYNGSVPGPTLRVRQDSTVTVTFTNQTDLKGTIHWHGLRLDNRFDGTHQTQKPVPVGGTFAYQIRFPDPGVYWYHPHIREDYGQELGLYGNILVLPADPEYWPPVHRELVLTLDDILIENGQVAAFSRAETTYAAMGRFGNVLLVGGEVSPTFSARLGEVVRFCLTNTANTRVFNVALPGARLKLVGGDSGRYEREEFVDAVIISPSERVVIDVLFEQPGQLTLEHRTPQRTATLAMIDVNAEQAPPLKQPFDSLRHNPEWVTERERLAPYVDAAPDKSLALVAEMDMGEPERPVVYTCPMHPEVVSREPGHCPKCGMKLLPSAAPRTYVCPMHPEVTSDAPSHCPKCGMKLLPAELTTSAAGHGMSTHHPDTDPKPAHQSHNGDDHGASGAHAGHMGGQRHQGPESHHAEQHQSHGHEEGHLDHNLPPSHHKQQDLGKFGGIEWEDDMVDVNRMTTPANMHWNLVDRATGAVNHGIDWQFRVGDRVKIRLINETDSDHPMHHPFHIHGAGRFVVLARDGVPEANLVWKDTVLVRTGETVDLLLDVTNPGLWMAHCHIAEHHESGMMFSFRVVEE